MRISDWSSDVCSSDLGQRLAPPAVLILVPDRADVVEAVKLIPLQIGPVGSTIELQFQRRTEAVVAGQLGRIVAASERGAAEGELLPRQQRVERILAGRIDVEIQVRRHALKPRRLQAEAGELRIALDPGQHLVARVAGAEHVESLADVEPQQAAAAPAVVRAELDVAEQDAQPVAAEHLVQDLAAAVGSLEPAAEIEAEGAGPDQRIVQRERRRPGLAHDLQRLQEVAGLRPAIGGREPERSEEHTSELQSLIRTPYAGFLLNNTK